MDPLAAVKCVGNIVAQPAVDASTKWFNYVQNYKDNIANVQLMRRDLENEQTEVQTKVDIGNRNNEEVVPEVRQWLKDAETFLNHDDWQDLLRDEEARRKAERCCCFGCCWSPRYRHGLSRRAEDKAEGISKMIQKMKDRGDARVTLPSRPLKLASTASNFCKGLKSREEKIDQILAALEKDNVNRIGIYGMGGSGKTTIVQELARRAENEKLFNEIVIAEISQFPDFTRIQNQIADRIGFTFNCHDIDERARNLGNRLMQIKMGKKLDSGEQHGNTKVDEPRTESGSQPKNVVPNEQPKNPRPDEQSKNPGPSEQTKHIKKSLTIKEDKIGGDDGNEGLHKGKKSGDDEKEGQMEKSGKKSGDDKKEGQTEKNGKKSGDDKKEGQTEKSGNKSGDDQKEGQAEKSGKLLVILDNIWKKLELERVGIPPDLEKDFGCKVIVTSRSKDVCKSMDTPESQIFKVGDLKDDEAKSLFRKKVGIMIDNNDYKIISEKILSRCSRLPLSISVLADMLKNQTISVWERILNQMENPSQGEALGVLGDTYSIIEISYNHLGDEGKKMFFLLCCIFPPGSNVRLDDLLRYGIGLGLFQYVNSVVEAIDQAHKWADDLKSLSLLSEVDLKKGEIIVHDDVREAGKTFATKGKHVFHVGAIPRWLMRDSYEKYTIVSMTSDDSYKYLAGRDLPKLQLLRCHGSSCINLGENYFSGMSYLKVLDLSMSEIEAFPPSIGHLQHIETLLLEYCSLKDISCISKLVNLQTLSLKKSNITRLPKEMKNLVKLKLLDLSGCDKLHDIRADIFVKLSHLEALYMKCSFSKWSISGSMARLSELRFLPLHVLEITIQSIKQLFDEDFPVLNLSSYKIYLAVSELEKSSSRDLQVGGAHASDLKKGGWKPLMKGAESLYLKNIEGLENVAPYLGEYGFGKLKRFKVSECSGMKYFINITQTYQYVVFPKLEVLCLEHLPDLVAINNGMSPTLFSDLQELTLSHLEGLKSFVISIEQANRLRVLEVKSCKNLEFIFDASSTKQFEGGQGKAKRNHEIQLPCLEELKLSNLNALRGLSVVDTNANDGNDCHLLFRKITFSSLDQMILNGLPKIGSLWDMTNVEEFAKAFPKLRSISLEDLKLNHVWSSEFRKGDFCFAKLKELKIRGCDSLKTVCPPSVARCLDQLELLSIQSCGELEQVISTEGHTSSKKLEMSFPNLLTIDFMSLCVLTHFYKGSMKVEFPVLKRLKLNTLLSIKTFVKVEKSKKKPHRETDLSKDGVLFNDEIKFPCLEQLYMENLRSTKELWTVRAEKFSAMFPKLQSLSLNSMVDLKYLWSKELTGPSPNFTSLKDLEICSCDSLESLFPPSTVSGTLNKVRFSELQTLKVQSTKKFKYFSEENVNVEFPVLKMLKLNHLDELKTEVYQSVVFPKLEVLFIENLPDSVAIYRGKSPPNLFSDLQQLTLSHIDGLKSFAISIQQANRMRVLEVKNCKNLEFIFYASSTMQFQGGWGDAKGNHEIRLPCLEKLILANLDELQGLSVVETNENDDDQGHLLFKKIIFPSLDKMKLKRLRHIGQLWDMTKGEEFVEAFPKLRSISLKHLELSHVWSNGLCTGRFSFAKLKKLKIRGCNSLKSVCPLSVAGGLDQLELLRIHYCDDIEQVISNKGRGRDSTSVKKNTGISFRNLLTLDFMRLYDLTYFYKGNMKMEFPVLKDLKLDTLRHMKTFLDKVEKSKKKAHREEELPKNGVLFNGEVKFPCLERLCVESLDSIEAMWAVTAQEFSTMFPRLQSASLTYMDELKHVWSKKLTGQSPSIIILKEIEIKSCDSLESLFPPSEVNGSLITVRFSELQTLKVVSSSTFKYFLKGNVNLEFPVLKKLELNRLSELKTFAKLQNFETSGGGEMDIKNEDDSLMPLFSKKILFPSLEELQLHDLLYVQTLWDITNSEEFNSMFLRLQTLDIANLSKLRYVWNDDLEEESQFCSLENITISGCGDLKSLFSFTTSDFSPGSQSTKVISFPKLQSLILSNLKSFECLFHRFSKMEFQALKMLTVKRLPMVKVLVKLEKYDPETGTDTDTDEASEKEESENEDDSEPDKEGSSLEVKPNAEADSEDSSLGANTNAEANTEGSGLEGKPNAELEKDDSGLEAEQKAEPGIEDSGLEAEPNAEPDEDVPSLEAKPYAEADSKDSGLGAKPNAELEKDDYGLVVEQNAEPGIEDSGLEAEPNAEPYEELPGLGAKPNAESDIEGSGLEGKPNVEADEEAGFALEGKPNAELEKDDSGVEAKQNAEPGNENSSLQAELNANEEGSELELEPSAEPDEEGYGLEAEPGVEEDGLRVDKILFRGNVEFSSLVELKVKYMDQLENIYETEMDYVASRSIFPKLRTLHLTGGSETKLKHLPEGLLSKLSSLSIGNFHKLTCLVSSANVAAEETLIRSLSELENLENLTIKDCDSIENLFEAEGDQDVTSLPNLRTLGLSGLAKLKQIKWHVLPNLQSLNLVGCLLDQEFLIQSPSGAQGLPLQQLEKMTVIGCERMEAIVGRSTAIQNDDEIVFPQLKEIVLWSMFSLATFCSASCTATRLPSLVSVDFYQCGLLRSFSSSLVVTPKLSQLEIETEFFATDEDLNSILQRQFEKNNMVAKYWPQKLKHKLHDENELKLIKHRGYDCVGCSKDGTEYCYACFICRFALHPTCALDESQLVEEPDEIKVGKDWQRTLKHELHENHEFKLVMGRNYNCGDCYKTLELYSYFCEECNSDLHPKCALREDAKCWPQKLKHKLHEEHDLKLSKCLSYHCGRCGKYGRTKYSYTCYICEFTLHPTCALDESQLLEEPDEIKVDWPRTLKHKLHKSHELKLVMGRSYICNGCREIGADQLFSYYCKECDFDLHPKCALPDISASA